MLCEKAKELVRRVLMFNRELCRSLGSQFSVFEDHITLTAKMTGIGVKTIAGLSPTENSLLTSSVVSARDTQLPLPPCSFKFKTNHTEMTRSTKLVGKFEPMVLDSIRRAIHFKYNKEERIAISELNTQLTKQLAEFDFCVSDRTLTRLLKGIGFRYQKVRDRCVLYERSDLIAWREIYLKQISDFRSANAYITYSDETWVFEGLKYPYDWVDQTALGWFLLLNLNSQPFAEDPMKFRKDFAKINPVPSASRGKRAIMLGVLSEEGMLTEVFEVP